MGRDFREGEDLPAAPRTAILSYAAWQKRYGGASDVLSRTVSINGDPTVIIGVLPPQFHFAPVNSPEFWTTLHATGGCDIRRSCHGLYGVGTAEGWHIARHRHGQHEGYRLAARTAVSRLQSRTGRDRCDADRSDRRHRPSDSAGAARRRWAAARDRHRERRQPDSRSLREPSSRDRRSPRARRICLARRRSVRHGRGGPGWFGECCGCVARRVGDAAPDRAGARKPHGRHAVPAESRVERARPDVHHGRRASRRRALRGDADPASVGVAHAERVDGRQPRYCG